MAPTLTPVPAVTSAAAPAADRSKNGPGATLTGAAAIGAAVLGGTATLFLDTIVDEEAAAGGGRQLVEALDDGRLGVQLSCGLGLLATAALLVFAVGIRRRLHQRGAGDTTSAAVLDKALTASAGAMFIGFGARAIMAGSLPSGVDGDFYSETGREAIYAVLNNFPYMAWMGVAFGAAAVAVLGFRHGAVTKPVAAVAALAAVVCAVLTLGFGLPYSSSFLGALWLLVAGASTLRAGDAR